MNFKERETQQKLRGAYYTPLPIAELLSRWVLSNGARTILEPGCGDGIFLRALANQAATSTSPLPNALDAVELVADEAAKSERAGIPLRELGVDVRVIQRDIFCWLAQEAPHTPKPGVELVAGQTNASYVPEIEPPKLAAEAPRRQWDAILGNPPYIRYQYFEKEQRALAEQLFQRAGIPFSKRTNAWSALLLACVMHLKPGGCLALVLPAELLSIQHAGGIRRFLEQEMATITLINIREMVFPDALQGVVLMLARKKASVDLQLSLHSGSGECASQARSRDASLRLLDFGRVAEVCALSLEELEAHTQQSNCATYGEWMYGLLTDEELALMRSLSTHEAVQPFVAIASVDIGIVTGANAFFVVDAPTLERFELAALARPMLARSDLIKGITYTLRDHEANRAAGKAVFFLQFPARQPAEFAAPIQAYLRLGEEQQLHTRYKCRIREPWYVVPYIWTSELALLKRCHLFPRLVINELGAHSTDTAYRIRLHAAYAGRARDLTFSFLNSLTFLCAELGGRHYGGGVLELVPSEIEKLLIPLQSVPEATFAQIDAMLRQRASLDEILAFTDPLILGQEGLGLTQQEIHTIQAAHRRLLKRRLRV